MGVDVASLAIKVSSDGIKEAKTQLDALNTSADKVEKKVGALEQAFQRLSTSSATLAGRLNANVASLREMATLMNSAATGASSITNALNRTTSAQNASNTAVREATRVREISQRRDIESFNASAKAYAQQHAEALRMNNAIDRTTNSHHANNNAMREAHGLARGLAGSMGALWLTYGNFVGMAAGVAMGASMKNIIKEGAAIEHTLEGIRVKGDETMASIDRMRTKILEIGQGAFAPRQVAEAFEVMVLAGVSAEDAIKNVGAALNLAVVGGVGIEKAAFTVAQVGTAVGLTADGFSIVADVIAKTAAVSMSSVSNLSEAFKSASSVSKMYKVSLDDIALGLAALSGLGITGSAAGTSLKNYYKELASDSEKIQKAFKDMKMPELSLRDKNGGFKDLITMTKELHEAMQKLTPLAQTQAKQILANERGIRSLIEFESLYAQKSATHANKFEELAAKLKDHAGYAALGAIQLSLTTQKEMEGVWNTLQASFIKAFSNIDGEVNLFAVKMKQVFKSPEFIGAVMAFSKAIASLVLFMAENIGVITAFVAAIAGLKIVAGIVALFTTLTPVLAAVGGLFTTTAAATTAVGVASVAGAAGVAGIGVAMTGLIAILALAAAAWVAYSWWKKQGLGNREAEAALATNDSAIGKLKEETAAMEEKNRLFKQGLSLAEATKEVENNTFLSRIKANEQEQISSARANVEEAKKDLRLELVKDADSGKPLSRAKYLDSEIDAANRYLTKKLDADKLMITSSNKVLEAEKGVEKFKAVSRINEANQLGEIKKQTDAATASAGTGTSPGKTKGAGAAKAAERDAFRTELIQIQGDIERAQRELKFFEEANEDKFKSGEIGKLRQIQSNSDKQIETYNKVISKLKEKLALESSSNKPSVQAAIDNKVSEQQSFMEEAVVKNERLKAQYIRDVERDTTQFKIKEHEARGEYEKAAFLKYSELNTIKRNQLTDELMTSTLNNNVKDIAKFTDALDTLDRNVATQTLGAKFEEANFKLKAMFSGLTEGVEEIKGKTTGGLVSELLGSTEIDSLIATKMPEIRRQLLVLQELSKNPAAHPSDVANFNKQSEAVNKFAKTTKNVFEGVGKGIENSLTKAFGKVGTAIGGVLRASMNFSATQKRLDDDLAENKKKLWDTNSVSSEKLAALDTKYAKESAEAQIDSYANIAGAAKGFFEEHSAGYKIMEGVEKAFHVVKLAMSVQSMVADAATSKSSILNSLATIPAAISAGAAKMFGQGGFAGFIGVAGMIAVMGALGYVIGGGLNSASGDMTSKEERQKKQGTGTVFGDDSAKSESLTNSMKHLEDNSSVALVHSQGMLRALKNIEASMAGLANIIFRTNGITKGNNLGIFEGDLGNNKPFGASGILGSLWGKKTQEISDSGFNVGGKLSDLKNGEGVDQYTDVKSTSSSFFGLKKKVSVATIVSEINNDVKLQFGRIFTGISDSIVLATKSLGANAADIEKVLDSFSLESIKISLRGLKGNELKEALNSVFSAAADDIAKSVMTGLQPFQKAGEGYYETLIRVAGGVESSQVALEKYNITAIKYTDILYKQGDVAAEIFRDSVTKKENGSGIGKIVALSSGDSLSDLNSLYEQLVDIRKELKSFGAVVQDVAVDMIKGAGSLDALSSGISKYYEAFFSISEQNIAQANVMTDAFAKIGIVGNNIPTTRDEFVKLVNSIDKATPAGQSLYGSLMTLAKGFDDLQSQVDYFVENLYSGTEKDALKQGNAQKIINDTFASWNKAHKDFSVGVPKSLAEYKTLTEYVKANMSNSNAEIAGGAKQAYALLVGLAPAFVELFGNVDKVIEDTAKATEDAARAAEAALALAKQRQGMQVTLLELQGKSVEALALRRAVELSELDSSLISLQQQIYALQDYQKALEQTNTIFAKQADLLDALGDKSGALAIRRRLELDAMDASLRMYQIALNILADTKQGTLDAMSAVTKAVQKEKDEITKAHNATLKTTQESVTKLNESVSKLKSLADSLKAALASIQPMSRAEGQASIAAALAIARAGGPLPVDGKLSAALTAIQGSTEGMFSSLADQIRDTTRTANDLRDLSKMTDDQLTIEERILKTTNATTEQLKTTYEAQMKGLDDTLALAQAQVDAINGVNTSVLSVSAALANLAVAIDQQSKAIALAVSVSKVPVVTPTGVTGTTTGITTPTGVTGTTTGITTPTVVTGTTGTTVGTMLTGDGITGEAWKYDGTNQDSYDRNGNPWKVGADDGFGNLIYRKDKRGRLGSEVTNGGFGGSSYFPDTDSFVFGNTTVRRQDLVSQVNAAMSSGKTTIEMAQLWQTSIGDLGMMDLVMGWARGTADYSYDKAVRANLLEKSGQIIIPGTGTSAADIIKIGDQWFASGRTPEEFDTKMGWASGTAAAAYKAAVDATAYGRGADGATPGSYNGSHANGLGYVPFDGYIAELHKGERVLTAAEAATADSNPRALEYTMQGVYASLADQQRATSMQATARDQMGSLTAISTKFDDLLAATKAGFAAVVSAIGLIKTNTPTLPVPTTTTTKLVDTGGSNANKAFLDQAYSSLLGRAPDAAGQAYWMGQLEKGVSTQAVLDSFAASSEFKQINGSHASGLSSVPFDGYIAELHKDEAVLTAEDAKEWREPAQVVSSRNNNDDTAREVKMLKDTVEKLLTTIATSSAKIVQNTKDFANTLEGAANGGAPLSTRAEKV